MSRSSQMLNSTGLSAGAGVDFNTGMVGGTTTGGGMALPDVDASLTDLVASIPAELPIDFSGVDFQELDISGYDETQGGAIEIVDFDTVTRPVLEAKLAFVKMLGESSIDNKEHWPWLLAQIKNPATVRPIVTPPDYATKTHRWDPVTGPQPFNPRRVRGQNKPADYLYTKKTACSGPLIRYGNQVFGYDRNKVGIIVDITKTRYKDKFLFISNINSNSKPYLHTVASSHTASLMLTPKSVGLHMMQCHSRNAEQKGQMFSQTEALLKLSKRSVVGLYIADKDNIWARVEAQHRHSMVYAELSKDVPLMRQPTGSFDSCQYLLCDQWRDFVAVAYKEDPRSNVRVDLALERIFSDHRARRSPLPHQSASNTIPVGAYFARVDLKRFFKLSIHEIMAPFSDITEHAVCCSIVMRIIARLREQSAGDETLAHRSLLKKLTYLFNVIIRSMIGNIAAVQDILMQYDYKDILWFFLHCPDIIDFLHPDHVRMLVDHGTVVKNHEAIVACLHDYQNIKVVQLRSASFVMTKIAAVLLEHYDGKADCQKQMGEILTPIHQILLKNVEGVPAAQKITFSCVTEPLLDTTLSEWLNFVKEISDHTGIKELYSCSLTKEIVDKVIDSDALTYDVLVHFVNMGLNPDTSSVAILNRFIAAQEKNASDGTVLARIVSDDEPLDLDVAFMGEVGYKFIEYDPKLHLDIYTYMIKISIERGSAEMIGVILEKWPDFFELFEKTIDEVNLLLRIYQHFFETKSRIQVKLLEVWLRAVESAVRYAIFDLSDFGPRFTDFIVRNEQHVARLKLGNIEDFLATKTSPEIRQFISAVITGKISSKDVKKFAADNPMEELVTSDGHSLGYTVCKSGNVMMAEAIFDTCPALLRKVESSGDTVFHAACGVKNIAMIDLLLNKYDLLSGKYGLMGAASVDALRTNFSDAIMKNFNIYDEAVLKSKNLLAFFNKDQYTAPHPITKTLPLDWAASFGAKTAIDFFVAQGVSVSYVAGEYNTNILHWAAWHGDLELFSYIASIIVKKHGSAILDKMLTASDTRDFNVLYFAVISSIDAEKFITHLLHQYAPLSTRWVNAGGDHCPVLTVLMSKQSLLSWTLFELIMSSVGESLSPRLQSELESVASREMTAPLLKTILSDMNLAPMVKQTISSGGQLLTYICDNAKASAWGKTRRSSLSGGRGAARGSSGSGSIATMHPASQPKKRVGPPQSIEAPDNAKRRRSSPSARNHEQNTQATIVIDDDRRAVDTSSPEVSTPVFGNPQQGVGDVLLVQQQSASMQVATLVGAPVPVAATTVDTSSPEVSTPVFGNPHQGVGDVLLALQQSAPVPVVAGAHTASTSLFAGRNRGQSASHPACIVATLANFSNSG